MRSFLLYIFIFLSLLLKGQDLHYSQYDFAPIYLNPANTGLFNGDYRFVANLRDQWFAVPVPYFSVSSSFDAKILPYKTGDNILSAGALFHYDIAGDSRLSQLNILFNLAYHQRLNKNLFLGVGLQSGFGQRRFRRDMMTFDDQFNGDVFDPNVISADINNLDRNLLSFFDIGTGLSLRYQKSSRTWLNTGFSMVHLNQPKQSFIGTDSRLMLRTAISANASVQLNPVWDIVPTFLIHFQSSYREILSGILARYHLNMNPGRETALFFGSHFRFGDALIPIVGINYQTWQFGFSYDINISKFNAATDANGGFEISLIHIWRKVPGLPTVKACPVF